MCALRNVVVEPVTLGLGSYELSIPRTVNTAQELVCVLSQMILFVDGTE
jgi:hypothetical protein